MADTLDTLKAPTYGIANPSTYITEEKHKRDFSPQLITPQFKRKDFNGVLRLYMLSDIASLTLGYVTAWVLAAIADYVFLSRGLSFNTMNVQQYVFIAAGVIVWFGYTNHYRLRSPFWSETNDILKTIGFAALVDGFLRFTFQHDFSRLWLILGWMFAALFIVISRNAVRSWLRKHKKFQVATLLVGGGETAKHTKAALYSEPSLGYQIVAQTKNLSPAFVQEGQSWQKLCYAYGADYIVIALDGQEMKDSEQLIAQLSRESLPFSVSPPLRHLPLLGLVPQYFFNHDVLLMTSCNKLEQPLACFIKRAFDILVSGTLLFLASPVLLTIGFMVKRDGGPALFGHKRVGKNEKFFSCLKFRSMSASSDELLKQHLANNPQAAEEWRATRKLKNDPRVTKIGEFLRKTSLDELPQLINVFIGDMSLVGPRPIVRDEVKNYANDISHYYNVRPGITGLWQVSGRNDVTYAKRVQMDSWYVRNWSLWQDIAILFKTFPIVLNRSGAY